MATTLEHEKKDTLGFQLFTSRYMRRRSRQAQAVDWCAEFLALISPLWNVMILV